MKAAAKIKKIIGVILFVAVVIAAVLMIFTRVRKKDGNEPTFFFGSALLWVETSSMEPTIEARSFISVRRYDGKGLKKGDVITFICTDESSEVYGKLVTHRIADVTENGYKTKGDNPSSIVDPWTVTDESVVAVYVKNLAVMTFAGRVFASGAGLAVIVATFLFSCAFIYIPDVVAALKEEKTTDKDKLIDEMVEKEVERMIKENGGDKDEK